MCSPLRHQNAQLNRTKAKGEKKIDSLVHTYSRLCGLRSLCRRFLNQLETCVSVSPVFLANIFFSSGVGYLLANIKANCLVIAGHRNDSLSSVLVAIVAVFQRISALLLETVHRFLSIPDSLGQRIFLSNSIFIDGTQSPAAHFLCLLVVCLEPQHLQFGMEFHGEAM